MTSIANKVIPKGSSLGSIQKIGGILCVCALLSACTVHDIEITPRKSDYYSPDTRSRSESYTPVTYGKSDSRKSPVLPDNRDMQWQRGSNTVRIYGFDERADARPISAPDRGAVVASDPSVVVYPFEPQKTQNYNRSTIIPRQPQSVNSYNARPQAAAPLYQPVTGAPQALVSFDHGSAALTAGSQETIRAVKDQYESQPGTINVEGHASVRAKPMDSVERHILNLKMSMNRAVNVSSQLIRSGVPAASIVTTAYGDTKPIGSEDANRRVELFTGGVMVSAAGVEAPASVEPYLKNLPPPSSAPIGSRSDFSSTEPRPVPLLLRN